MTPKRTVLLSSVTISVVLTACFLFLTDGELSWKPGVFLIISFILTYGIIFRFTRKYIYKKLIPIYRTIFGMDPKEPRLTEKNLLDKPFAETEKHVKHWTDDRVGEMRTLKEKDDFRKEFIGNLAHELKTPLFSIQGYVSSLLEGAMDDDQVKEKFLKKANKNIDRMTRIIEDLDTITQMESGLVELDLEKFNVTECALEVIDSLEKKAQLTDVEVVLKNQKPIMVQADEFRIGQVLTNLINNAITYGKEGGKVEIDFTDFEERVLISVRDNGKGIDKEKIPRLFERFYRVDKSRSRDVGGTGLGLAIVKHIIEAHEQTVSAQSKLNEGSTFSFTLAKA